MPQMRQGVGRGRGDGRRSVTISAAYYNENDPVAAAWLRELIRRNLIAPGDVDERSILDVHPYDLRPYRQCHFFAGIGAWSYALRRAKWDDDRRIWTCSCPCQPFSDAGRSGGFADERHLWPAMFHFITQYDAEHEPPIIVGEQVASKDGLAWLDLVRSDLEGTGRAVGAGDLCGACVGSPQIRQRLYFVGIPDAESDDRGAGLCDSRSAEHWRRVAANGGHVGILDDRNDPRSQGYAGDGDGGGGRAATPRSAPAPSIPHGMADNPSERRERRGTSEAGASGAIEPQRFRDAGIGMADGDNDGCRAPGDVGRNEPERDAQPSRAIRLERPGPINGFWRDADWLHCRDERWRPVEPGSFPLAYGVAARVGRLRGYGNTIIAPLATAFIESVMEILE